MNRGEQPSTSTKKMRYENERPFHREDSLPILEAPDPYHFEISNSDRDSTPRPNEVVVQELKNLKKLTEVDRPDVNKVHCSKLAGLKGPEFFDLVQNTNNYALEIIGKLTTCLIYLFFLL